MKNIASILAIILFSVAVYYFGRSDEFKEFEKQCASSGGVIVGKIQKSCVGFDWVKK